MARNRQRAKERQAQRRAERQKQGGVGDGGRREPTPPSGGDVDPIMGGAPGVIRDEDELLREEEIASGAALSLALLGPLTVARQTRSLNGGPLRERSGPRTRSSRLPVRRMRLAPAAVLAELDPVRIVSLGLLCLIVASLALLTSERHADSDVSACHCSSKLLVRAQRWRRKTSPGSARLGAV